MSTGESFNKDWPAADYEASKKPMARIVAATLCITKESVHQAHRLNLPLHAWTVNDIDGMKKMIALDVDAIVTDYPERLLALLKRGPRSGPAPIDNEDES